MRGKASRREPSAGRPRSALAGAMFLMATSAIGPGFITQTTQFTAQLGAAFAFAILASVLVDVAVQLNVWRVIGVSGLRAQDLADRMWSGLGAVLAGIVVLGGLVFNVGNVAGAGLGLEALLGLPARWGGALSAVLAVGVFLSRRAGVAMDRIVVVLGALMIVLTTYVALVSDPPVGDALRNSVLPERIDLLAITTLIGGTVGGYITYAGAHRLVDAGVQGVDRVGEISRAAVTGVLLTGAMRVLLFLAVLGVVSAGHALDPAHPAASAFEAAAGEVGRRVYGLVLWAAAITSVIGASYTSVSFFARAGASDGPRRSAGVVAFIAVSAAIYLAIGTAPVSLLVFAGAFNGILLPAGLAVMLWIAVGRPDLLGGYRYPRGLIVMGVAGWLVTLYLGARSIAGLAALLR
ncbi:MAG: divalent metal cation transporter [Lysobacterales bacterium]|nr:MAG: divalent metal cation transporter [Xanthomonadales bacterium]